MVESISSGEFQENVQMKPTLSAGCTPGGERGREGGERERGERRRESVTTMPNVVCNAVFLSVIGSI